MLISSIALLAFMLFVSFQVWPQAVLFISFLAGLLVTLQYLLFGVHRMALGIRWVFKRIGAGFGRLLSRNKEVEPLGKGEGDSSKVTTDTIINKVVGDEEKENEKQT